MPIAITEADIKKQHRNFTTQMPRWQLVADCLGGEDVIKKARETYLPYPVAIPPKIKEDDQFKRKYEVYLSNAEFTNFVEQTTEDLVAGCFKREVITNENFPERLGYINLDDTARDLVDLNASYGRAFVLSDYPTVENGKTLTKQQETDNQIQAFISIYHPMTVINWETKMMGGNEILTRVVLVEESGLSGDTLLLNYRELFLDEGGTYNVRLHKADASGSLIMDKVGTQPKMAGKTLKYIPGVFVGSINNTSKIGKVPVLGIAQTNIKHYRTMAELFYVQTMVGHPQLVVTGVESGATQDDEGNQVKVNIEVGTTDAMLFEGGETDAKFLEIDAASLIHFKTLEQLEKSMLEQGARIKSFNMKAGVESAEALRTRNSGSISTLAKIATNCERGLQMALFWANGFMGGTEPKEDFTVDINKEFFDLTADPSTMTATTAMVAGGQAPDYVLFNYLRKTGMVDESKTDDEIREDLQTTAASAVGITAQNPPFQQSAGS